MPSSLAVPSMEFSPYFAECPMELESFDIYQKINKVPSCERHTHLYSKIIINPIVMNLYNLVLYIINKF